MADERQAPTPGERTAIAMESFARSAARIVELLESVMPPIVAPASELDSKYGDPLVPFDVPGHPGLKGKKMSYATPDGLEALAEQLEYMVHYPSQGKERFVTNNRRDAARARGWAKRLRSGWTPPTAPNGVHGPATAPPPGTSAPSFAAPSFAAPTFTPPSSMTSSELSKALERPPGVGDSWEPPDDPPPAAPATKDIWDDE